MKKFVLVFVLAAVIATGAAFADHPSGFGIGVQGGGGGGWGGGFAPGFALTLKLPSVPIFWAIDLDLYQDYIGLKVAGDYYLIDNVLVSQVGLHWYLGVGGYVGLGIGDDYLGLGVGARLPIGLSWQPVSLLEIYLQVVPSIGVNILPEIGLGGGWGGNLGLRLWF